MATGGEILLVFTWLVGFHAEYFDEGSSVLPKMEARLNDTCVIENHQGSPSQIPRQGGKGVLNNLTLAVDKQFAGVTLGQREFGYSMVGQVVIVVCYTEMVLVYIHEI